jgi:predicted TPR repeat methyltransferase
MIEVLLADHAESIENLMLERLDYALRESLQREFGSGRLSNRPLAS